MKLLAIILLLIVPGNDITKIAKINKMKKEGEQAYQNGDYGTAISNFRTLTDSMDVVEDPLFLNLAHAYYQSQDTANAMQFYARVLGSNKSDLRSKAYQQLGVINMEQNKLEPALKQFKQSLKADPSNADARYNYELVKKMLDQQQQQQEQDKNEDIEPSDYAKKLKKQADNLAAQFMFDQALKIMQLGLQEDETVAAYNGFISKLNNVVESQQ